MPTPDYTGDDHSPDDGPTVSDFQAGSVHGPVAV